MINFKFDNLLIPINIYRIFLAVFFIVASIKANYILDFYTFLQVLFFIPLVVFILTYKNLWVKKIEEKNKYEKTIEEIVFKKNKKGIKYFFNLYLFYISNILVVFFLMITTC